MNTAFGGNQVGSRVSLDDAGSYPTGLLAALTPYNIPAELISAQIHYTATQGDIVTQLDSAVASALLSTEKTGLVSPSDLKSQLDSINYIDAASEVNYANQNLSDLANTAYTNARVVSKMCNDASYSAYLVTEAFKIQTETLTSKKTLDYLAREQPDINPSDKTTKRLISTIVSGLERGAVNKVTLAHDNVQSYIEATQSILSNAYLKSSYVTNNLTLVNTFDNVVKMVTKAISDPLSEIAGKETLITQYIPKPPLANAITVATNALNSIKAFILALNMKQRTSATINSTVTNASTIATGFSVTAKPLDVNMYLTEKVKKEEVKVTYATDYYSKKQSLDVFIKAAADAKLLSLDANISAHNARAVSNALLALKNAFSSTIYPEAIIYVSAKNAMTAITDILSVVNTVTSNSSPYSAVAITRRASNTIVGKLNSITEQADTSLKAATDALAVKNLLYIAMRENPIIDGPSLQSYLWTINAAKGKAEEVCEKLKKHAYELNRTAHNLVTPQRVATQTLSASMLGISNMNTISRISRTSRNVPSDPPPAYVSYKADIRAKTFQPEHQTAAEILSKQRYYPLRLDSQRTISEIETNVARQVQRINDISAFSFRQ